MGQQQARIFSNAWLDIVEHRAFHKALATPRGISDYARIGCDVELPVTRRVKALEFDPTPQILPDQQDQFCPLVFD